MIVKHPPSAMWIRDPETGESMLSIEPGWSIDTETGLTVGVDFAVKLTATGRARLVEMISAGPPPFRDAGKL